MKTYFKIQLFDGANLVCEQIALMAAKNNSGETHLSLAHFEQMALFMKSEPPINTALADNKLYIDIKNEAGYVPGCIIEEVEIFELQQVDDIPESLYRIAENGFGALAE